MLPGAGDLDPTNLDSRPSDYLASLAKGAVGLVPFGGGFLAEAITGLPGQLNERLQRFCKAAAVHLQKLDQDVLRSKLADENVTDLSHEAMIQATRALTDERREYIAQLLINGIKAEDVTVIESRKLLGILGQLNDVEIIWLRFYAKTYDREYYKIHADTLATPPLVMGADQRAINHAAMQEGYKAKLAELGLLRPKVDVRKSDNSPTMKIPGFEITLFGRLLLREIGQPDGSG